MNAFSLFIKAFKERNFYILGAGASAKIIPFTSEQGARIVQRHLDFGMFSLNPVELNDQAKRIIGSAEDYSQDSFIQELIQRLPSEAAILISRQLMTPSLHLLSQHQPQYSVFNLAPEKSIIFNFNVDGLAHHFCKNHYVLHPHGRLNAELHQSKLYNDIIDFSLESHKSAAPPSSIVMPGPEPTGITKGPEYKKAFESFRYSRYVIIIGYSFGYDGNKMDDWESFEFLKKIFLYYKVPIFIVDPYPEKLAYKLRDELKQKNIYEVTADWGILSKAIIELEKNKTFRNYEKDRKLFDIYYLYCKLQDDT